MNKVVMFVLGMLFTSRLFASIAPHVKQLEHDAPILLRSALIVFVAAYVVWIGVKYFKKRKVSDLIASFKSETLQLIKIPESKIFIVHYINR